MRSALWFIAAVIGPPMAAFTMTYLVVTNPYIRAELNGFVTVIPLATAGIAAEICRRISLGGSVRDTHRWIMLVSICSGVVAVASVFGPRSQFAFLQQGLMLPYWMPFLYPVGVSCYRLLIQPANRQGT